MDSIEYFNMLYSNILDNIKEQDLDQGSVKNYVKHLPVIGISGNHPQSVYEISTKCLVALWQYSIAMRFTDKDKSFIDFLSDNNNIKNVENLEYISKKMQDYAFYDGTPVKEVIEELDTLKGQHKR